MNSLEDNLKIVIAQKLLLGNENKWVDYTKSFLLFSKVDKNMQKICFTIFEDLKKIYEAKLQYFPEEIVDVLGGYPKVLALPSLKLSRNLDYLDSVKPWDLSHSLVRGLDQFDRPFIALKIANNLDNQEHVVTLFKRYISGSLWCTCPCHPTNTPSNHRASKGYEKIERMFCPGSLNKDKIESAQKLLKGQTITQTTFGGEELQLKLAT